ncbi:hypothetical protein KBD34_02880 [Patescibacteria group bacterium]|nr:hypothetical protein [Patescibacteria group bacterium]
MLDYTLVSRFRNKERCEYLVAELVKRGKSCHNFCITPSDPNNPTASAEAQMRAWEETKDFFHDPYFRMIFEKDLKALKEAQTVLFLLPCGTSAHMEAGIAYGLGKHLILIGEPEKPESLYIIFEERYPTIEAFMATLSV